MTTKYERPSDAELKKSVTPLQFKVIRKDGTEPPFKNEYWDNKEPGIYVDRATGEPLFSSTHKYKSGTGWPSFTQPLEKEHIVERADNLIPFMKRTEVRSRDGDSHLGHVFSDGPQPTGRRYCINSAALRFIPTKKLNEEGYGQYASLFEQAETTTKTARTEKATLAGGCFWGVEELFRKLPGVIDTTAGYTGGSLNDPTYNDVKTGSTGHAESVQIVYDPARLSYEEILHYFFRLHDPTTKNRQGNDRGVQYRSAIFYHSDEQKKIAETVKRNVDTSGKWKAPLVTEIVAATPFYKAEEYHQDYLQKVPDGYTCHFLRD